MRGFAEQGAEASETGGANTGVDAGQDGQDLVALQREK